ncbi:unnamed protein product [Owenia fusiformis]|uniref:Tripartite motif-containing protein 2-like n=1 Tax=Owenia fusiformis TaxID=6347 RepID=A0A8S4QAW7_OWEFU|nr:unnamed protein product [Owenia fusiformis]
MASSDTASSRDHYKEAIICAICQDTLSEPRTLPCMHSYCLKCLDGLVEGDDPSEEGTLKCPECRQECGIPEGGVKKFKVSPTVTFLLETLKNNHQDKEAECSICRKTYKTHTLATIRCLDCNKTFCDTCHITHDSMLEGHKVLDLTGDNAQDLETALQSIKERTVFCLVHPTKPLELYCKVDQTVLCQLCYPIDHPGHACEDIKQAAVNNMKPIGAVITQGKVLVDIYEQAIDDTQAYKADFEQNVDTIADQMINDMNTLIQSIREKYKSLTDEMAKEKESHIKQIMSHQGHLELQRCIVNSQVSKYCSIVDHAHPVEIADLVGQINQKLQDWTQIPKPQFLDRIALQYTEGISVNEGVEIGSVKTKKLCTPTFRTKRILRSSTWDLRVLPNGRYVATLGLLFYASGTWLYDSDYTPTKEIEKHREKNFKNLTLTHKGDIAFTDQSNAISICDLDGIKKREIVVDGLHTFNGITTNSRGELAVCDHNLGSVLYLDPNTGEPNSTPQCKKHTFKCPMYVAINSKDVSVVSDISGHCVKGINPDGTKRFTYGGVQGPDDGQLNGPRGVFIDACDNIMVADTGNHRVILLSPEGRFLRYLMTADDGLSFPNTVTINHNEDELLIVDSSQNLYIVKYRE